MRGVLPDDTGGVRKGPPRTAGKRAARAQPAGVRDRATPGESPALRARAARKSAMAKVHRQKKR